MTDLLELPQAGTFAPKAPDGATLGFTVNRVLLDRALSRIASVVPTKDPVPVLKNFHVRLLGTDLRITGTDSVLSAVVHIPVTTASVEGSAVFPSARLHAVVREASGDDLTVTVKSKNEKLSATVRSGKAKWEFPLMSPAGFPDFSEAEKVETTPVNREGFLAALSQVRKAASHDVMRPYLMLVDVSKGRIRASDSVRFQEVKFAFPFDCQIPIRAAQELTNRLTDFNHEEIRVGQTNSALLFRFGLVLLICQKSAARFPDVDAVLLNPNLANDQHLTVDRQALLSAVKRVRITADENTSAVVLSLNTGSVSVECKDRRGGYAVETIPAEWTYSPRHVSFNHQHLCDLLSSTKSETCSFRLGKDLKTKPTPLLMEDIPGGFIAVLSQIRLDWL